MHWLMLKGLGVLKAVWNESSLWKPVLLHSHTPEVDLFMGNWDSEMSEIYTKIS